MKDDNHSEATLGQLLQNFARQGCAINSGLLIVLIFSLNLTARYFLKFTGAYQTNNVFTLPHILTIIGLLLGVTIFEISLWKIGCARFVRSGIWWGLCAGLVTGFALLEKGISLPESIAIGIIVFTLVFTGIYLLDRRQRNKSK
jgi:uncharacterized membrane protein (DUF485 family)